MSETPAATDEQIIVLVLAGDRDQFAVLVMRYQRRVCNSLRLLSGNAELAEELTQEAFCRAYAALGRFNPEYRFSSWLYQIAVNLWRSAAKRGSREVPLDGEGQADGDEIPETKRRLVDPDAGPEARAVAEDSKRRVWEAVDQLSPDYKQIVVMRHVMELSYQEIGDELGLPMGTVKSRLARARAELAAILGEP